MGNDSNLLDWDITDAPDPDEVAPRGEGSVVAGTPRPQAHGLSRRTWLMLGGIILLAMGSVSAFSVWDQWRVLAEVRQAIAAETQNIPLPNYLLHPSQSEATVLSVTMLSNHTAQAEVARAYLTSSGQPVTFTLSQFYQFNGAAWQRLPIPETYWGEGREYRGQRIHIRYAMVDEDFVKDFGPFAEAALVEACETWTCHPSHNIALNFSAEGPRLPDATTEAYPADAPSTLALLWARADIEQELRLPSPHLVGYPADEASREVLKRALALQALIGLANELAGSAQRDNAYLYAFVARMGARLGLEAPNVGEGLTVQTFYEPGELWELAYASLWQSPVERDEALRAALGSLNDLLVAPGLPANAEARLFASLRENFYPTDWYAEALNVTRAEAQERLWQSLLSRYQIGPFASPPDLLLQCVSGPALYHLSDQRLTEFLPFAQSDNAFVFSSWSPTGEWLALFPPNSQRVFLVNLRSGAVTTQDQPPTEANVFAFIPKAWVDDMTLAYIVSRLRRPPLLRFMNVSGAERAMVEVENVWTYALAPNGGLAVIQRADQLELIPAWGGPATLIGAGHTPRWLPGGQSLIFDDDRDPTNTALSRYTVATGQITTILDDARINQAAWSLTENLVAVATLELGSDSFSNNYQIRVGAVSSEGLQWRWLDPETIQSVFDLEFSADGKFLAALQYGSQRRTTFTVIYDVATGQRLREIESTYTLAWSPTGHRLALSGANGVYLVDEPADSADPSTLAINAECYSVLWNPAR